MSELENFITTNKHPNQSVGELNEVIQGLNLEKKSLEEEVIELRRNLKEANNLIAEKDSKNNAALASKTEDISFFSNLMNEISEIKLISESVIEECVPKLRQLEKARSERPLSNERNKETNIAESKSMKNEGN
jgi:hypothetical protein